LEEIASYDILFSCTEDWERVVEARVLEQIGILKRAELEYEFNQVKLRAKKLKALHGIGTAIASALDLEALLTRIVEAAVFITDAEQGSLLLLDEQTQALHLRAQKGLGEKYARGFSIRTEDSIAGEVIRSGEPRRLTSAGEGFKVVTGYLVHAILYVPIAIKSRVVGVLAVDNQVRKESFSQDDENLLLILAGYAAIAFENARLLAEAERKALTLSAMRSGDQEIAPLDPGTVCLFLQQDAEVSQVEALTPQYLSLAVVPYLSALVDLQQIVDELEENPPQSSRILAITEGVPVSVTIEGVSRAVQFIQEVIAPWALDHAKPMAHLAQRERKAAIDLAQAEILEARARANEDAVERKKLLAKAADRYGRAETRGQEGKEQRQSLQYAQIHLALQILSQVGVDLQEEEKAAYLLRLLPTLETLLSSPLQISAVYLPEGLEETGQSEEQRQ
jgi:hypothetical protein